MTPSISILNGSVNDLLKAADVGSFMQAEIVSLSGLGKLRVTCNWLYSSLNCDPDDTSTFLWQFNKVDNQHISLSPVTSCIGPRIFASVRDDINNQVQVQAPYSADWIKAVGRDEIFGFTLHDLSIAQLNGFNQAYIAVNNFKDSHGSHSGYRVTSNGKDFDRYSQWFIDGTKSIQPAIQFKGPGSLETLQRQLDNCSIRLERDVLEQLIKHLTH